jgi:hypothetical protein
MSKKTTRTHPLQFDLFDDWDEGRLVAIASRLGALSVPSPSTEERSLARSSVAVSDEDADRFRSAIEREEDPLGEVFCALRSPATRRSLGATYTPPGIVLQMVRNAKKVGTPVRIVDPGCGSARFLVSAGREFPNAELIGFEVDPVAALIGRAHLAAAGLADRATIHLEDYRAAKLPQADGKTLFIGNPPYVRHHLLSQEWKEWLVSRAAILGLKASQLAGLHVHFFLATALQGRKGDFGSFITAAEWLEVNYGSVVRDLFLKPLGGTGITVIEPTATPFPDAATTAAVTDFEIGTKPEVIRLARVESVTQLASPEPVRLLRRERLESESRWSHLTRGAKDVPTDFVELGELCRVHRGTVTGANRIWIAGEHSRDLPEEFLYASVTKARELFSAGAVLSDAATLRRVIDLPVELDGLDNTTRRAVDKFLKYAKSEGGDAGYIARTRKAWWSVGLRKPAPILATYMARRPPTFVRNPAEARHINIAHGLYPRESFDPAILDALARFLSTSVSVASGRTYAGGLTKFEPREMERLLVPRPEVTVNYAEC